MDPELRALLDKIESGLTGLIQNDDDTQKKIDALHAKAAETAKRIEEVASENGEAIKSKDTWIQEVEAKVNSLRFDTGKASGGRFSEGDALLNALEDEDRRWIGYVERTGIGDFRALGLTGDPTPAQKRAASLVRAADPVAWVASGAWFQAQALASMHAAKGNARQAEKFRNKADKLFEALGGDAFGVQKALLQEDTAGVGGYLIPTITEQQIGWIMKDASVCRASGATVLQMTTKTHQLPTLANDFTVTWETTEGDTINDSAPATPFGQGDLTCELQAGLVTVTLQLLQDNVVNLMDFVMTHLLTIVGRAEDLQCLEGATNPFDGLYTASGVVDASSGTPAALALGDIPDLVYGAEHQATMDNGVIWCHPWVIRDAIKLTTGSGGALVFPMMMGGESRPRNLLGVPVFATSVISRTRAGGTNTETTLYHGNPAYMVIGDRMGTQFDVNPFAGAEFKAAKVLLRLIRRVGVLIWVPTAFTKKGDVTVS